MRLPGIVPCPLVSWLQWTCRRASCTWFSHEQRGRGTVPLIVWILLCIGGQLQEVQALIFCSSLPTPFVKTASDNRLSAIFHIDVLDNDLLLAAMTMLVYGFDVLPEYALQFGRTGQIDICEGWRLALGPCP